MIFLRRAWTIAWQVGVLSGLSWLGTWLTNNLGLPIPGNVLGLLLLFLLLTTGVMRIDWLARGAGWLLDDMLLFFIPAAVGIVEYTGLMRSGGIRILLVIALSTTAVMLTTGLMAEHLGRMRGDGRVGRKGEH